ncbi:MAG TPA: CotH kinase family protein [Chitinophagaceae bacterium]
MRKITIALVSFALLFLKLRGQSVNFTSSNLPIVVITTNGLVIPDDPKIDVQMGIIYNGPNLRNNITDSLNNYKGDIGIELHGHSSQMFPMKSYGIELRDSSGNSQDYPILGLPKESDWILYAPYTDKTLMRNFLAYTLSRDMGRWAARCRYVELVIDNDYKGVYVMEENIKRNSNRVNIAKIGTTDTMADALTGGYIFSLDKDPDGWFSSFSCPGTTVPAYRQFSYVYPKLENIVPAQQAYIKNYVDSFEIALASPGFQDPSSGVRKFADMSSFVDYFIINELSRNVDGYRLSAYFYKDRNSRNSKIFAGPVWDYDLAFRNADYCAGSDITGWAYRFNTVCSGDPAGLIPFWWNQLMTDTAFESDLRCRWKELRLGVLSSAHIDQLIDSISTLVNEAQQRHFVRWPILGQYVWPNPAPIPSSYMGELSSLKAWIDQRLQWIDTNIPNSGHCSDYPLNSSANIIASLSPNPASGDAKLTVLSKSGQAMYVNIFDAMGRRMQSETVSLQVGNNIVAVHSSTWTSGVYFIYMKCADGEQQIKRLVR